MAESSAEVVLGILAQVGAIVGSVLAVGAWICRRFDRVNERFEKFCAEIRNIQLESQKHVTFEHCHTRRENCPLVQSVENLERSIKNVNRSKNTRRR